MYQNDFIEKIIDKPTTFKIFIKKFFYRNLI